MREVCLIGAGQTCFGDFPGKGVKELFAEAYLDLLASVDKGLDPERIGVAYIGSLSCGGGFQLGNFAPLLMGYVGLPHVPALHVESACASSGYALLEAIRAVASGECELALAGGVEKMRDVSSTKSRYWLGISGDTEYERLAGLTFAGIFALVATRFMHDYGLEKKHLSMIAVKNHRHGAKNPKAQLRMEVDMETAMRGPMIAYPLNLWDCCPTSDGASCVLVCDAAIASQFSDDPVYILGWGAASDHLALHDRDVATSLRATVKAAEKAYRMAGVTPQDVDLCEVHDCFTISEAVAYADLGLCRPEEVKDLVESGATALGGRIPVNVSGGLKSKGHPIGATGTSMAYEMFDQLRGQAKLPERQVQGARIGLTHNIGGLGGSATVFIYGRGKKR